jgi:hypothetical protein
MFSHNESKNTICPSFLLKAWDYIGCVPSERLRNGLVYGMSSFMTGIFTVGIISEGVAGALRPSVRNKETCNYEEKYINESSCEFDGDKLNGHPNSVCREFINQTDYDGHLQKYDGPLTNCTSIDTANSFIQNASTFGENQCNAWSPGAAERAFYCTLIISSACGAAGFLYGFFKKPAVSLSSEPASEMDKEISNTPYSSLNG